MSEVLNIAQLCPETYVLGPGKRFVVWAQGCPFRCVDCVAPDWIPNHPNNLISIEDLAQRILAVKELEGITLSGGEPMLQAEGLAKLIRRVRRVNPDLSAIAFSGFTLAQLRRKARTERSVAELLPQLDVLIDGLYRPDLNDNLGLRGSSNQRIHFLTTRYEKRKEMFETQPRQVEIHLLTGELLMVGVPAAGSLQAFRSVVEEGHSTSVVGA